MQALSSNNCIKSFAIAHWVKNACALCKTLSGFHTVVELPLEEHQAMLETQEIDEDLAKLLASGMLEMTMTLATVTGRLEEDERLKALSASIH